MSNRLNADQKRLLCHCIAIRLPTLEIIEKFREDHDLEVSPQSIYLYKTGRNGKKWPPLIEEFRAEYDAGVTECFLSAKRNRLNSLHDLYVIALASKDVKGGVMALTAAHKEMEGTKVALVDKDGDDFSFVINIGPPPDQVGEPKNVGPVLTLLPFKKKDDNEN